MPNGIIIENFIPHEDKVAECHFSVLWKRFYDAFYFITYILLYNFLMCQNSYDLHKATDITWLMNYSRFLQPAMTIA